MIQCVVICIYVDNIPEFSIQGPQSYMTPTLMMVELELVGWTRPKIIVIVKKSHSGEACFKPGKIISSSQDSNLNININCFGIFSMNFTDPVF